MEPRVPVLAIREAWAFSRQPAKATVEKQSDSSPGRCVCHIDHNNGQLELLACSKRVHQSVPERLGTARTLSLVGRAPDAAPARLPVKSRNAQSCSAAFRTSQTGRGSCSDRHPFAPWLEVCCLICQPPGSAQRTFCAPTSERSLQMSIPAGIALRSRFVGCRPAGGVERN